MAEPAISKNTGRCDEAVLWNQCKREASSGAREQLFNLYAGLARRIAHRHFLDRSGSGTELPDLCQLAYAGLLEAIDRFDPALGVGFAHYAERRIAGSVVDGVRRASELREQMSFRKRMRRERAQSLAAATANDLTADEALDALVDAAVGLALGFMLEGTDIFVPEGKADRQANAYESLVWREAVGRVRTALEHLPERERMIVQQHYFTGVDFERLGALLGVSKGRVSQLHKAALTRLRAQLNRTGHFSLER